jgi:predicted aminopeptidase
MRRSRILLALALTSTAIALSSCATLSYYWQAFDGQMEILNNRRPITQVVADRSTPGEVRERLAALIPIREFASKELALPDNRSYRSYADLRRPYVIWNVFATEEFSVEPSQWCFPIAGCVPYRGYFSKARAQAFAANLPSSKYDVFVAGVPAYSTLGYFDDPILNTFLHYPDYELARLVFHELAHQIVYVQGDAMFNESFATAVEEAGVERWLALQRIADTRAKWSDSQVHRKDFQRLVLDYRQRLQALYGSTASTEEKRTGKARIFADLKEEGARLKEKWGGYGGYDRWFSQPLNNAHLAAIAIYTELVPAFHALLDSKRGDFRAFYTAVKQIAKLPKAERDSVLRQSLAPAPTKSARL